MESAAVRVLALLGLAAVVACVALMVPVGHAFAKPALRRSKAVCGGGTPFRRRNLAAFKKMALAPEKRLQMKKSTTKKEGKTGINHSRKSGIRVGFRMLEFTHFLNAKVHFTLINKG